VTPDQLKALAGRFLDRVFVPHDLDALDDEDPRGGVVDGSLVHAGQDLASLDGLAGGNANSADGAAAWQ
jgi:hypothetical protein